MKKNLPKTSLAIKNPPKTDILLESRVIEQFGRDVLQRDVWVQFGDKGGWCWGANKNKNSFQDSRRHHWITDPSLWDPATVKREDRSPGKPGTHTVCLGPWPLILDPVKQGTCTDIRTMVERNPLIYLQDSSQNTWKENFCRCFPRCSSYCSCWQKNLPEPEDLQDLDIN